MGSSGVSVDNGITGDAGVSLLAGTVIDIGVSIGFGATVITWPTGTDGPLSINGTNINLPAGSIKNYSSISIINNGTLTITNSLPSNVGCIPTIIGCSGNLTINTGGKIIGRSAAGATQMSAPYTNQTFTNTVPAGGAISSVSFDYFFKPGGAGGDASSGSGGAALVYGHGGGGAGDGNGGNSVAVGTPSTEWGKSGDGAPDNQFGNSAFGTPAYPSSFGAMGSPGEAQEGTGGITIAGGGAGGTRGLGGNCLYLQVAGVVSVSGVVINLFGGFGGDGGNGGTAIDFTGSAAGGGGGGGGSGGNGGKFICRYKSGSITGANVSVVAGAAGNGGPGGVGEGIVPSTGNDGIAGTGGDNGTTDIATY